MAVREADAAAGDVSARRHPTPWPEIPFECPPALNGLRVLGVDDDADARQLLKVILERCHAQVTTAHSVAEAIDLFDQSKPDVLVSDIEMPGEDGYSCIRRIRAKEGKGNRRIPAAALTAHAGVADRMRALSAGFDIHVPKPVEPAEFVAVIASLASRVPKA
jgi:CheY-like chemotaxis protein